MPFPFTPYLTMVIVGFVSFVVVLAYGRARSGPDDRTPHV